MRYLIILSLFLFSCSANIQTQSTTPSAKAQMANQLQMAVLWYQQAAEMRLSYYQAFEYGKLLLDKKLAENTHQKPAAVVLDIDETVLDNSPYEAYLIDNGITYEDATWKNWTSQARAEALPGALDFVNYVKSKGVEVIYISNRAVDELEPTLKNLKNENFPNATEEFVLLKSTTSNKTPRREKVMEKYDVLLFVGDNLTDFSEGYANRDATMGKDLVDKELELLLENFVMLPNPMYGEWEKAIYENNYGLSDELKLKKRKSLLKR